MPLEFEAKDAHDPVDVASGHEQLEAVASAIQELPTRQRQAVVLSDLRGLSNNEVAQALSVAPGTVEALLYRGRLRVRRALRRSWPATAVVPLWLRDAVVRLAAQLETSVSAAPAARVAAGVAVAVVAASAATVEIEHPHAKPRAPRVHAATRDTQAAALRHSAISEMVSVRRDPATKESHGHSVGQASSGHGRRDREDERSGRGPSRPHAAAPVTSSSGPGPSDSTQQVSAATSSGPGPSPAAQPASTDNSGPGSHESTSGQTVPQPDSSEPRVESGSSGPSLESSSSGPSLELSGSGSGGSNSGPGSLSSGSGSDSSGSGSLSSGSGATGHSGSGE